MTPVRLRIITACSREQQLRILEVRNQAAVRKWMYTDHLISAEEHEAWLRAVQADPTRSVFLVLRDEAVIGMVSLTNLDRHNSKSDWAFYLDESARGGLGAMLELAFLDYVFLELGLQKLNCEVIDGNDPVIKMHRRFCFEVEGLRRSNVAKDGERLDVHLLGLTRDAWLENREECRHVHAALQKRFDVAMDSDGL